MKTTKDDNNAQLKRDLAAARERIGVLEGALGDLRDELEMDVDADVTSDNRELLEIVETALAAPEAEGKAGRCDVLHTSCGHAADCAHHDQKGCTCKPPEPQPEEKEPICECGHWFSSHKGVEFGCKSLFCQCEEFVGRVPNADALRAAGWLSPAEAERFKDELKCALDALAITGKDKDILKRREVELTAALDEQRARAEKLKAELDGLEYKFSCVLDEATNGRCSKPNTEKAVIYNLINEARQADYERAYAEDWYDAISPQIEAATAAQARADSLEVQCAAMREALDDCHGMLSTLLNRDNEDCELFGLRELVSKSTDGAEAALQSDAGRGYVRAERLRAIREALRLGLRATTNEWHNKPRLGQEDEHKALADALALLDTLLAESEGAG